jgi:hypothetical protein
MENKIRYAQNPRVFQTPGKERCKYRPRSFTCVFPVLLLVFIMSRTSLPKHKFGLESIECSDTSFTSDIIIVEINAEK